MSKELNKWESILSKTNIDPKYYDKVITYIDTHIMLENTGITVSNIIKSTTSLHVALDLISKLEHMDNIEFLTTPSMDIDGNFYRVGTMTINTPIVDITMENTNIDVIKQVEEKNINNVAEILNKRSATNKLYIYSLYSKTNILHNSKDNSIVYKSEHRYSEHV